MSSKSKKHSRKGPRPKRDALDEAIESQAASQERSAFDVPDDLVHVPKETSPLRFLLMIALIIVLLVIFIVPQAIMGAAGGGRDTGETFVGWMGPDGEEVQLGYNEFISQKRILGSALRVDPYLAPVLGLTGQQRSLSDEQTARFLVLDRMAEEAGLHVPDEDLVQHLRQLAEAYGGVEGYQMNARSNGGLKSVEATIRRVLRVARYRQVPALLASIPDPAKIEELWNSQREELQYDFAFLSLDSMDGEARAELPDDAGLEAWLGEQSAAVTRPLENPEKRSAEVVSFLSGDATPGAGLLAAFPEPEPTVAEGEEAPEPVTPEELARQFYDQTYFWHFLTDVELDDEGNPKPPGYVPFEEVAEQAQVEAPVYFAMQRWLEALRAAEEPADLEALAGEYGLSFEQIPLSTRDELVAMEEHKNVGQTFATRLFQTNPGELSYSVVARGNALSIVRVSESVESSMPPFAEIRDQVADLWVEDRVQTLAVERLDAVREGFGTEPLDGESDHEEIEGEDHDHHFATAETFADAIAGLGLSVQTRAWLDKGLGVPTDPNLDDDTNTFFRTQRQILGMQDGEVSTPLYEPTAKRVYLVRLADRRPVPLDRMSPQLYDALKQQASMQITADFLQEPSDEFLEEEYGLYFVRSDAEPEEEGEGETEDAEEG